MEMMHRMERGGKQEMCKMMMHRVKERAHDEHGKRGYVQMVLKQAEDLKLTDEQLGKIVRIQMHHQKSRWEIIKKPA